MDLRFPAPNAPVTVLLKLAGETCNINCVYCYEKRKPYDRASYLTPRTLERFLDRCGRRPLAVAMHGGEPMLIGRTRMHRLLGTLKEYAGEIVSIEMQTNGTLLDDAWLDFFDEACPEIDIGISLDGDAEANAYRIDFRGRPTNSAVAEGLRLMERRGRTVGIISVVTRKVLGRAPMLVDYFRRFGAIRVVKLAPCLDYNVTSKKFAGPSGAAISLLNPLSAGRPGWATTPGEYSRFVSEVIEYWRTSGAFRRFLLEPFFSIARATAGKPTTYTSWSDRKDTFLVTLYPDGRIGSSDLHRMPESSLGHVDRIGSLDEILYMQQNARFANTLQELLEKCSTCAYETRCRGGDLPDRLRYAGTSLEEEYCNSRRRLVDHVQTYVKLPVQEKEEVVM